MYTDVAFLRDPYTIIEDTTRPFVVTGCGHNRLFSQRQASGGTNRPEGRKDYQLIYIAAGKGHFWFQEDKETIIDGGNLVLYRPHMMQKYRYYMEDQPDIYWVHFTGGKVEELLKPLHITETTPYLYCGTSPEYQRILHTLIQELWFRKPQFEEILSLLFQQFLVTVSREMQTELKFNSSMIPEIENATNYFHEHYSQQISIEAFAATRNMSISWFIRSFKQYHGKTPLEYILDIRITTAQYLLETSHNNISEIGAMVGYEDPMYFSKLFKRKTGFSPKEYRNRNRQ